MAITAATKQSDFDAKFLPPHIAAPIFDKARQFSVVQSVVQQIPLGMNGEAIPVSTTRPTASWVDEAATKPATSGAVTIKTMTPKKLAAIMVVSQEVARANPVGFVSKIEADLAEAFGRAFDYAALHNLGGAGTGTGPFATYFDQTTKSKELGGSAQAAGGLHQDLVAALGEVITDTDDAGRPLELTGWLFDSTMEVRMRSQVDTTGRPLWEDIVSNAIAPGMARTGSVLNRPSAMGSTVREGSSIKIAGYGGDFTKAAWGVVGGISFALSTETAVTINGSLVSLWENNLVAVRAEAEYGFILEDPDAIVQLRNDSGS